MSVKLRFQFLYISSMPAYYQGLVIIQVMRQKKLWRRFVIVIPVAAKPVLTLVLLC